MACIFGQRSKSAPGTPQDYSEVVISQKYFNFNFVVLNFISFSGLYFTL